MKTSSPVKNVAIFGVPRSGTTWIGQIFNSSPHTFFCYQPIFSYEFKNRLSANSSKEEIDRFHTDLLHAKSDFVLNGNVSREGEATSFRKEKISHLVWKEVRHLYILENLLKKSDIKIVCVVRDPRATMNSWLRVPQEFKAEWDPISEWRYGKKKNDSKEENFFGYEKWKEAMRLFLYLEEKYPDNVILVKYEDLVLSPIDQTNKMFQFVGLQVDDQTENFLKESSSKSSGDAYSVYRKQQDPEKWRGQLNPDIERVLTEDFKKTELMKRLGYSL